MHAIPRGRCRQMLPNLWLGGLRALAAAILCVYALGAVGSPPPAQAADFSDGELRLSLDTTLSHGLTFRLQERDDLLATDVNGNDGDLNYDRGLVSNTSKFTTDLDLGYRNFGAFLRLNGFLDFENEHGERERTPLSDEAKELVGQDIVLLDAYLTGAFDVGNVAIDVRLGSHVLNWGESTFIQNGINAINPFDVSKLRLPGSELREGLLPVPMVSASVALTYTLSVEGFYQLDWEKTKIDPVGSYFSVTDYVGAGAKQAEIDLSTHPTLGPFAPPPDDTDNFLRAIRLPDRAPSDSGQGGVAFRYFAETLNATEFGFYFVNYHSRLPTLGVHTGTQAGVSAGVTHVARLARAAGAAATQRAIATAFTNPATAAPIVGALLMDPAGLAAALAVDPAGVSSRRPNDAAVRAALQAAPQVAADVVLMDPDTAATVHQAAGLAAVQATPQAIDLYAKTGGYFVEYPEDLQLFGVSFNTELGATGWALQGEYSFRPDAPLQVAEAVVLAAGLHPITESISATLGRTTPNPGHLGVLVSDLDQDITGYILRDVSQVQATATKVFGPVLGSDSGVFLTETALMHVHGMPDNDVLPLESPAGEPDDDPATNSSDAEATSWGYRLAMRLDYNNAIGAVNLFPYLQFQHDVGGNSPSPSGSFVEGRTAVTLGLRAGYLSRWEANLNLTMYGGKENELHDRDFISATVKYSF